MHEWVGFGLEEKIRKAGGFFFRLLSGGGGEIRLYTRVFSAGKLRGNI